MRLFIILSLSIISCTAFKAQPVVDEIETVVQNQVDNKIDSVALLLIERSVNSEELKQYYHFELKERGPSILILNTSSSFANRSIRCFDHSLALFSNGTEINRTRALELLKIDNTASRATLILKYAAEGITAKVDFQLNGEKWNRISISITEN